MVVVVVGAEVVVVVVDVVVLVVVVVVGAVYEVSILAAQVIVVPELVKYALSTLNDTFLLTVPWLGLIPVCVPPDIIVWSLNLALIVAV